MSGAFGLISDPNLWHFPLDRIVENVARIDVWALLRCGALTEGVVTQLAFDNLSGNYGPLAARTIEIRREGQNLWIGETCLAIVWDSPMEGVDRPWFECACGRKVRYLYLRDTIQCAKCHGLQHACLHQGRQMPALRRVERLRRRLGGCELRPFTPLPDAVRRLGKRGGGRSKAFHDALVAQILDQEAQLVAYLGSIVYDLDRRLKGPRGRKKRHGQTS